MTSMGEDEEAKIEEEIRRELDALGEDDLEVCDIEDEDTSTHTNSKNEDDVLPDTVKEFLKMVHSRNTVAEDELKECAHVLSEVPDINFIHFSDKTLASKIQESLGSDVEGDPLELRNKVLAELEEDDINDEKEKLRADATEEIMALDIIRPDIMEEIRSQEVAAQERLFRWEEEQKKREEYRQNLLAERRRDEELRKEREQQLREQKQIELEEERRRIDEQQLAMAARLEQVLREEEEQMEVLQTHLQEEIRVLELEKKMESEVLVRMKEEEAKNISERLNSAATKIQKHFRRMRVQKHYKPILDSKREERLRKRKEELDTIERVERKVRENAERRRKEEEEKKKKEIEERKHREEKDRELREKEQRKREEEKKKQEAEEMKRKEQEKRKREEEKKKYEAEELERKEDEMKKKVELEERMKQEQEERERKEEEERKRKREEEARKKMAEEKRKLEEQKLALERERKRLEDEENARKEMEEKMKRELEEKRKKELEEKKKKELEEERRKNEEIKRREEEEKRSQREGMSRKKENTTQLTEEMTINDNKINKDVQNPLKQSDDTLLEINNSKCVGSGLEDDIEQKRLDWIKQHQPWSSVPSKKVKADITSRSKPRRLLSASRHPHLTVDEIIQASPPGTPVHQVTVVILKNLQSCNLQGLQQCPSLKYLFMDNCGIVALNGLNSCKELCEIHVLNNKIELINDVRLNSLECLDLENNNLTSIHGLETCPNLRSLTLKNNRITRLAGLQGCPLLQNLILDNNQLIMVKGLVSLRSLQRLSCVDNHLTRVTDLEDCGLLYQLHLQGNNLHEAPSLTNLVLLRELFLDDNSISSLEPLSTAWLPLLQHLSVSQNSLSCLTPLKSLIMLQTLDVRNNIISDLESLIPGLDGCQRLQTLRLEGNPVIEEPECRSKVVEVVPCLTNIDGFDLHTKECEYRENKTLSPYITMCLHQIYEKNLLEKTHENDLKNYEHEKDPGSVIKRLLLKSKQFQELHELAVKHRQQHESFNNVENTEVLQSKMEIKTRAESTVYASVSSCEERSIQHENKTQKKHSQSPSNKLRCQKSKFDPDVAATKIQALWRGWYLRHQIDVQTKKWLAAVTIQSTWRGFSTWRKYQSIKMKYMAERHPSWQIHHHQAATLIQAAYRGYSVRRRFQDALSSAQYHHEMEDDFNYDEEVDLTAFDFDESALDSGWTPAETPHYPSRPPVLPTPPQQQKMPQEPCSGDMAGHIPWRTRHAWRSADSPITDAKPLLPHKPNRSPEHDHMSVTSAGASSKQEELSHEWGFRNTSTAELMMKRAKRMKKKNKPKDADSRLALFKKLDESNKPLREVTRMTAPSKKPPPRVDYFAAKEFLSSVSSPSPDSKAQMTYSWVYNQAVVHQDEQDNLMSGRKDFMCDESPSPSKRPHQGKAKSGSPPVTLPQMDYVMLSGRSVPLVASPVSDQNDQNPRGNSYNEKRQDPRLYFPPIRSPSVPNLVAQSPSPVPEHPREKEKSNSAGARISKDRKGRR